MQALPEDITATSKYQVLTEGVSTRAAWLGCAGRPRSGSRRDVKAAAASIEPVETRRRIAVLGSVVAGPAALARFGSTAPANTDDHPVVAHRAPFITYAPDSAPRDRLLQLLRAVEVRPDEVLDAASIAGDPRRTDRLDAYWNARNRFIEVGIGVVPNGDPQAMLAQVRRPLLEVVRMSPDFGPARSHRRRGSRPDR